LVGSSILSPGTSFALRRARNRILRDRVLTATERYRAIGALQRHLLVAALLARVGDAELSGGRRYSIWGAAFSAFGFDSGIALLDGDGFALQRLFHQPLGFVAHGLFRHFTLFSAAPPVLHVIAAIGNKLVGPIAPKIQFCADPARLPRRDSVIS
jgi:hypothetical protein